MGRHPDGKGCRLLRSALPVRAGVSVRTVHPHTGHFHCVNKQQNGTENTAARVRINAHTSTKNKTKTRAQCCATVDIQVETRWGALQKQLKRNLESNFRSVRSRDPVGGTKKRNSDSYFSFQIKTLSEASSWAAWACRSHMLLSSPKTSFSRGLGASPTVVTSRSCAHVDVKLLNHIQCEPCQARQTWNEVAQWTSVRLMGGWPWRVTLASQAANARHFGQRDATYHTQGPHLCCRCWLCWYVLRS
mgnify:CR=1 FL=1